MHCVHLNLWIIVMAHECYDSHLLVCIALKNSRTKILCSCSWMPGFVPSLHQSRSPLISQHDDSAILFFVGCWVWGNLDMERKLCALAAFGNLDMERKLCFHDFFHFAIKMKLQIRWDFCLKFRARNYGFPAWNPVFLSLLLSLLFHSKGKRVFVNVH